MDANDRKKDLLSFNSHHPLKDKDQDALKQKRRQHNTDLIHRMRQGESLRQFDKEMSWFPPRPLIAKDRNAITNLYDLDNKEANGESNDRPLKPLDEVS